MTNLSDDQIKYAKYKWEFLRRNAEFINDWEKLQCERLRKLAELIVDWKKLHKDSNYSGFKELLFDSDLLSKEENKFCKKWGIKIIFSPYSSYEDIVLNYDSAFEEFDLDTALTDYKTVFDLLNPILTERKKNEFHKTFELFGDMAKKKGLDLKKIRPNFDTIIDKLSSKYYKPSLMVLDGWNWEPVSEKELDRCTDCQNLSSRLVKAGILKIEVDLNYSKKRLLNDFKILIDKWKKLYQLGNKQYFYKTFCEEKGIQNYPINEDLMKEFEEFYKQRLSERQKRYRKKYHFENFDLYLKIYDLKQEGVSWSKITTKLNLNSTQNARNHYNAARKLIEKGIDLYVK